MANTNSPIELLIALGVADKQSRSNITTYLDNLKKDLKLDISINPNNNGSLSGLKSEIKDVSGQVDNLNTKISNTGKTKGLSEELNRQKETLSKMITDLTRTENMYKRTFNKQTAAQFRSEIEKLSQAQNVNIKNIETYRNKVDQLKKDVRQFSQEQIQASRNSTSIIDSFKIAMERFPIWMAASTAFYGTVRTAKEFMSILVDIDTKLVSIQKVTGDSDISATFDRATLSAEKFGQSISQALDAYIEFSRQGYKGDDLGILADAGLVASNVGEISAQAASEYMTSALTQWKKDTSEAMGIIDSWNNISNNYATTVEKLAQG